MKDKIIVSATLARPEYVALVATSEAAQAEGLSWRPRTAPSTQQQRSVLDYYLEVG